MMCVVLIECNTNLSKRRGMLGVVDTEHLEENKKCKINNVHRRAQLVSMWVCKT